MENVVGRPGGGLDTLPQGQLPTAVSHTKLKRGGREGEEGGEEGRRERREGEEGESKREWRSYT